MSAEYFLDTNILVYSFDARFPEKRQRAQSLIGQALETRNGAISWQVTQEFMNVARHKFERPLTLEELSAYLDSVLIPLCAIHSSPELYRRALSIQLETQYRFYDCLVVASALQLGCRVLYSEDLQADRQFGPLTIRNPFE